LVYKWFLFLHKLSYVLGIAGYIIMIFTLMGLNFIFGLQSTTCMDTGILLLFYGLYYGVLGRDFAHICTDRMACKIGYFTHDGLPKKHLDDGVCAVCDNRLVTLLENSGDDEDAVEEKTYRLSCGHIFHEFCIRGWVVVGKLQTCPYCKEKVDLQRMFKNPWEKPHLFYGQLLDWIRYLVCWQPLIVTFVQGLNHLLGLE
ncbi:RING finger protein, partial [Trichostrongylus colubriformis]